MKKSKRLLQGANWGVFLILALALLFIVNYLGYRHYHRWDWSSASTSRLSQQTKKVLGHLEHPVKVVVFLAPGGDLYTHVNGLLSSYKAAAPAGKFSVEYIDPDRQRARMEMLARKYNVTRANVVVFSSNGHSKYVTMDQMADYSFSRTGGRRLKTFKAEEAFTNAILFISNPERPTVYFTEGHGEAGTANPQSSQGGASIAMFKDRLRREGDHLKTIQLLGLKKLPDDADLVVVAGPQYPFAPQEAALLENYLKSGGHLLLLLDPAITSGNPPAFEKTGLEALTRRWGIELENDVVVDPKYGVPLLGAQDFLATRYSDSPVTRDLMTNNLRVLFSLARSLKVSSPGGKDVKNQFLVQSSMKAWGMTSLAHLENASKRPGDIAPPLTLAAAAWSTHKKAPARLIVVGDSDFLGDSLVQSDAANMLFAMNAVHWLLSQENQIAIPPKSVITTHLSISASQMRFLLILFVFLLPAVMVGTGVYIYFRRRH